MKQKAKIVAAIASLCFCILIYLVLSVAISGLLEAFPDYSENTLMLLMSLPSASALVGVLGIPVLVRHFTKKSIALTSLLCLAAGGAMSLVFSHSFPLLVVASLLMGLPYGTLSTLYPLLVKENFNEEEATAVVGFGSCFMQLGGLITKMIGGYLADIHWSYVYITYFFVLVAMVVVWLGLPKEKKPIGGKAAGKLDLAPLKSRKIWVLAAIAFVFPVLYFIISTHMSLYVEGYGLGTAVLTGNLSAVAAAVAAALSFLFPKILRITKKHTFEAAFLIMGLGYAVCGLNVSLWGIMLATVVSAVGISLFTPYMMVSGTIAGSKAEDAPLVTSFLLLVINVAYFASPYINNFACDLLASGETSAVFLISGVAAVLCAVVLCFFPAKAAAAEAAK